MLCMNIKSSGRTLQISYINKLLFVNYTSMHLEKKNQSCESGASLYYSLWYRIKFNQLSLH